jgi:hypothetical protein
MSRDSLVVGINTYEYTRLGSLKAPAEDAEAIAQILSNLATSVYAGCLRWLIKKTMLSGLDEKPR